MTISYENTPDDAVNWNLYRLYNTPRARRAVVIGRVLSAALVAAYLWWIPVFVHAGLSVPVHLLLILIGGVLGLVLRLAAEKRTFGRQTKALVKRGDFDRFLGQKTVTLMPEGVRVAWNEGETLMKWSGVKKTAVTDNQVILFWSENEPFSIPKRAFASEAHQEAFLSQVERYRAGLAVTATTASSTAANTATGSATPWYQGRYSVESEQQNINRTR